jgi:hypothetical protein
MFTGPSVRIKMSTISSGRTPFLPYPAGWLMALAGAIFGLVRFFKAKGQAAHA